MRSLGGCILFCAITVDMFQCMHREKILFKIATSTGCNWLCLGQILLKLETLICFSIRIRMEPVSLASGEFWNFHLTPLLTASTGFYFAEMVKTTSSCLCSTKAIWEMYMPFIIEKSTKRMLWTGTQCQREVPEY